MMEGLAAPFPHPAPVQVPEPVSARETVAQTDLYIEGQGRYRVRGVKTGLFDGTALPTPWQIRFQQEDNGTWQFGVDSDSDVYDGVNFTHVPVTGLLTDYTNPADNGWKTPKTGFVFLWGTMKADGVTVDKIEVKNDQTSLDYIKRVDSPSGKQTHFAFVLGYLWQDSTTGQWWARQEAWRHVTLLYVVVNGLLCKVPFEM